MISRRSATRLIVGFASLGLTARRSCADSLAAPAGTPILSISGKITNTSDGATAHCHRSMLEALGQTTIHTTTP